MSTTKRRPERASLRPDAKVSELLAQAATILNELEESEFMKKNKKRDYPTFDETEIQIGQVLGVGGFGVVREILEFQISNAPSDTPELQQHQPHDADNDDHYELDTAKDKMMRRCLRYGQARYAVKFLGAHLSELDRTRGMIDMALEVKYLMVLWHPNIVKMRGICAGDILRPNSFFIMDRLLETLESKILEWAKQKKGASKLFGFKKDKLTLHHLLTERLLVAYDLANAFSYMHENRLVYRDIKQENFGFDIRGDIKVFDFGLTKALSPSLKAKRGNMYNLTPITGSMPYMAPEVAQKIPYDERCDCFSFAFLLWEILSLKKTPYHTFMPKEYFDRVVKGNIRPAIRRTWPNMTREVLLTSWVADPEKRPHMKNIAKMIREDLNEMSRDDNVQNRTKHMVNRSQRSMDFQAPSTNIRSVHQQAAPPLFHEEEAAPPLPPKSDVSL